MSLLRRLEKSLDQRMRGLFGGNRAEAGAREAIELYRDALDQIAARATAGKRGARLFPFDLVTIELRAENAERKAVLEALFEAGQLLDDVRTALAEERVEAPADLAVAVQYPPEAAEEMLIVCSKRDQPRDEAVTSRRAAAQFVRARLTTMTGAANVPELTVERTHANIGRESEVVDAEGRTVRRNDLFFTEHAHEANPTVSRSHAHIRFDPAAGEWRIYDDGSSLGTSVFRHGRRVVVPAHSSRGVLLRSGDEIYLGQVQLRFDSGV